MRFTNILWFGKKELLYSCILISLMKLMREFPKKVLEGGGEGDSFSLHYRTVGQTKVRCSWIWVNDPMFYLSFISKFHINHLFPVIVQKSVGSFGSRPPWWVQLTVTTEHNFSLLLCLENNGVPHFYIMLLNGWNGTHPLISIE